MRFVAAGRAGEDTLTVPELVQSVRGGQGGAVRGQGWDGTEFGYGIHLHLEAEARLEPGAVGKGRGCRKGAACHVLSRAAAGYGAGPGRDETPIHGRMLCGRVIPRPTRYAVRRPAAPLFGMHPLLG